MSAAKEHQQRVARVRRSLTAALVELNESGEFTPCQRSPELWTSEDAAERAKAVPACAACPLRTPCRDYSILAREGSGVWAGKDRSRSYTRDGVDRPT